MKLYRIPRIEPVRMDRVDIRTHFKLKVHYIERLKSLSIHLRYFKDVHPIPNAKTYFKSEVS